MTVLFKNVIGRNHQMVETKGQPREKEKKRETAQYLQKINNGLKVYRR